jgi:pimeloyl-ACP methyl ester carboxylesterase
MNGEFQMPFFTTEKETRIYYEHYGKTSGPVVLLIHGLAGNLKIWCSQAVAFSKHFQVYALDLPGHGQSDRQSEYDIQEIPLIIKAFMDNLGFSSVNLVGLSIGSTGAVLFAAQYPDKVSSLVLVGPVGGCAPLRHPSSWINYLQLQFTVRTVLLLWAVLGKKKAGHVINWLGQTYKYVRFLTKMEEETDARALEDYTFTNADAPYENHPMDTITAPVLILRGTEDQFPVRHCQHICTMLTSTQCLWLEIPRAQHLICLTNPEEFNLTTVAFLQENTIQPVSAR